MDEQRGHTQAGASADDAADEGGAPLEGDVVDDGGDADGGQTGEGAGAAGAGASPVSQAVAEGIAEVKQEARRQAGRGAVVVGAVLVAVGLAWLATRVNDVAADGGAALIVGVGFLAGWAVLRNYGLLIPGAVLTGLGAGFMLNGRMEFGNPVALGLGAGFVAVCLLDVLRDRHTHWWPLVPGLVLVVTGLLQDTAGWDELRRLGWPLVLIIIGLLVLGGALRDRTRSRK